MNTADGRVQYSTYLVYQFLLCLFQPHVLEQLLWSEGRGLAATGPSAAFLLGTHSSKNGALEGSKSQFHQNVKKEDGLGHQVTFNNTSEVLPLPASSAQSLLALAWRDHRLWDLKGLHDLLAENKQHLGTAFKTNDVGGRTTPGATCGALPPSHGNSKL